MIQGGPMSSSISHASLSEQIVEDSPLAIIFADKQGTIRLWNRGAELTFGYTAEEATGQSLDIIVPERHRAKHWEGWERVMQTGVTKYARDVLAVPALRKDGVRISVEFTVTLVRTDAGVLGAAAVIQDVSARWERDKALRARLAELEKTVAALEKAQADGDGLR
jgi:PAS domain S-box-containing protein